MKVKGRRQSSNIEVRPKSMGAKQDRRLPPYVPLVTAPALGAKIGVNSMKRSLYKRGRNP